MILPPSLEELIPLSHPVRVVNEVIASVNLELLEKRTKGRHIKLPSPDAAEGASVWLCKQNVYSSRKLEAATKENIH